MPRGEERHDKFQRRFAQSRPDQTYASETSSRKSNQTITNNHPDGTSSSCEPEGPTERTALEP